MIMIIMYIYIYTIINIKYINKYNCCNINIIEIIVINIFSIGHVGVRHGRELLHVRVLLRGGGGARERFC